MSIVLTPPCPPHRWSHAPTTDGYGCMKCNEYRYHNDPRHAEAAREYTEYGKHPIEAGGITPEWCLNMAKLEIGMEVGAGMPDHPLRCPPLPTEAGDAGLAFQPGVDAWMDACFGEPIKSDQVERADRFCEEALELCQTMSGFSKDRAHALVDYVFDRPQGEINQEVGGVMVTLAALCNTTGVNIDEAAQTELARVWTKVEAIRAKQAAKPTGSALPTARTTLGGHDGD